MPPGHEFQCLLWGPWMVSMCRHRILLYIHLSKKKYKYVNFILIIRKPKWQNQNMHLFGKVWVKKKEGGGLFVLESLFTLKRLGTLRTFNFQSNEPSSKVYVNISSLSHIYPQGITYNESVPGPSRVVSGVHQSFAIWLFNHF